MRQRLLSTTNNKRYMSMIVLKAIVGKCIANRFLSAYVVFVFCIKANKEGVNFLTFISA